VEETGSLDFYSLLKRNVTGNLNCW